MFTVNRMVYWDVVWKINNSDEQIPLMLEGERRGCEAAILTHQINSYINLQKLKLNCKCIKMLVKFKPVRHWAKIVGLQTRHCFILPIAMSLKQFVLSWPFAFLKRNVK